MPPRLLTFAVSQEQISRPNGRLSPHALYWNPRLKIDENGCATVGYYNGHNATYMDVNIETLLDDKPAAVNMLSYPTRKR
jgi:hypothetical protein